MTNSLITIDRIEREQLLKKVEYLCKLHKCNALDLLILSIDAQAQLKQSKNNN